MTDRDKILETATYKLSEAATNVVLAMDDAGLRVMVMELAGRYHDWSLKLSVSPKQKTIGDYISSLGVEIESMRRKYNDGQ